MSQTRVCEPPCQGESSTDSSTRTAPELSRSWSDGTPCSGVTDWGRLAGFNRHILAASDLPPTRSTSSPPLTGLTCGLQVIEALHHVGGEFHSLSEDFDTSTATGRLQLAKVLAFSEWWRNSIRERSVAGQAKARSEGRFPGRRPSLTQQQREYIRLERSKEVSQGN